MRLANITPDLLPSDFAVYDQYGTILLECVGSTDERMADRAAKYRDLLARHGTAKVTALGSERFAPYGLDRLTIHVKVAERHERERTEGPCPKLSPIIGEASRATDGADVFAPQTPSTHSVTAF